MLCFHFGLDDGQSSHYHNFDPLVHERHPTKIGVFRVVDS